MIGKRGKLLILVYIGALAVLFLMCSTDLIIREPEREIFQVAVIIEDMRDDNYGNFRKGMDQAAMEFNADVRFITLYEKQDARQQMELINREQQDGADGLIVVPVDESMVVSALSGKQVTVPAVLLGSGLTGEEVAGTIMIDYKKMGEKLAEAMVRDVEKDCQVLVISDEKNPSMMNDLFLEGAMEILEKEGYSCRAETWDSQQDPGILAGLLADQAGEKSVILAESPELLTKAAGILADSQLPKGSVKGLYGRGTTVQILNYLDRGVITGICVTDEFSRGYFSVRMLVQALEGLRDESPVEMESYYIRKKDLRDPAYEKMLYPIE